MVINDTVKDILINSTIRDNVLYLSDVQLDRKTYESVNKVIEMLGGKWNRKLRGHVFEVDPTGKITDACMRGKVTDWKQDFQFFPTPRNIAEHMCDLAEINGNSFVLEPSCGKGDLADVIYERSPAMLWGIEINPDMDVHLRNKPYDTAVNVDFLKEEISGFWDRIIMNPPFNCGHGIYDIDHIMKAYSILADGGILVSVVSESAFQKNYKKSEAFRRFLKEHNAYIEKNDNNAFKSSGTLVATRLIKVVK